MNDVLHTRVYKRTRRSHGKAVTVYRGYYTLEKNGPRVWKALGTPDKAIAEKRIMGFALEAQREREGIIAPRSVRDAAAKPLSALVTDYDADLGSRSVARKHRHDTIERIKRVVREAGWKRLTDIDADSFVAWRTTLDRSAKTKKEYQISLNAFLNWLVNLGRLPANPLARVDTVPTRGKEVRPYRTFTVEELSRLFAVAGKRLLAYQTLLYTAQRKSEVRALVWGDLHLEGDKPHALFRAGTMKDKDNRAVPLRRELAAALLAVRPKDYDPAQRVFWFCWPTYDILKGDLKRAGIERKDGLGRVLHFHSFRKTLQTLGVSCGVNQRAAQEILGHSDANLTAKVYTDVPSLELHREIEKLPWVSPAGIVAQHGAQNSGVSRPSVALADICAQFAEAVKVSDVQEVSRALASCVTSLHLQANGCPGWDRTSDQVINSHLLCH